MKKITKLLPLTVLLIAAQATCGFFGSPGSKVLGLAGLALAQQTRAEYKYRKAAAQLPKIQAARDQHTRALVTKQDQLYRYIQTNIDNGIISPAGEQSCLYYKTGYLTWYYGPGGSITEASKRIMKMQEQVNDAKENLNWYKARFTDCQVNLNRVCMSSLYKSLKQPGKDRSVDPNPFI